MDDKDKTKLRDAINRLHGIRLKVGREDDPVDVQLKIDDVRRQLEAVLENYE